ncbi:hypothetical protein [Clostridium formicaceticum]|uniref:Uncharacterized protein n=1 Tax=Clostridium formicaceticum TaxID=1497 RepID=A0AAC9RKP8_9CLOT|nr:hypothetical protein [Clostridium formicaceticum]AOY74647.1 hypothetical protein BJL90_00950 [Clostridium formicaceticum]ARE89016.1 hypothetical protein CLFO_34220 [Clostridium formicaceticum]
MSEEEYRKAIIANATNKFTGKGRVTFAEFKDASNNVIGHYSQNNGWTMVMSKAEMKQRLPVHPEAHSAYLFDLNQRRERDGRKQLLRSIY